MAPGFNTASLLVWICGESWACLRTIHPVLGQRAKLDGFLRCICLYKTATLVKNHGKGCLARRCGETLLSQESGLHIGTGVHCPCIRILPYRAVCEYPTPYSCCFCAASFALHWNVGHPLCVVSTHSDGTHLLYMTALRMV